MVKLDRIKNLIKKHNGYRSTNREATGFSLMEEDLLLENDILGWVYPALKNIFGSGFDEFTDNQQIALYSMMYNLGEPSFLTFHKMNVAIIKNEWGEARLQALDSKWRLQVGKLAEEIADLFVQTEEIK